jgi:hypothetical protein
MAYEIASGRLIDCCKGRQDLDSKTIRMVSESAFLSDPLRLLRAFRLSATLDFNIEERTKAAIRRHRGLIRRTAGERVRDELFKMFENDNSHRFLCQMVALKLLFEIFPELSGLQRSASHQQYSTTALAETLDAFGHLEEILKNTDAYIPLQVRQHFDQLGKPRSILLKCAILWLDIGTQLRQTRPVHRANLPTGNEAKSTAMVLEICNRLRFSNRDSGYIESIARNQSYPCFLFSAFQNESLQAIAATRFFIACQDQIPDLIFHALAQMQAKKGNEQADFQAFADFQRKLINDFFTDYLPRARMPRAITGHDLIKEFGLQPSPLFGSILDFVEEQRLSRKNLSRKEAIALVKGYLHNKAPETD